MLRDVVVKFHGPFSWLGNNDIACVFTADLGKRLGIYLWTVKYRDGDLIYYVGETGRPFSTRMLEHFKEHMSGGYHLNEPTEFMQGHKIMLWPGRYDPVRKTTVAEFLQEFSRLAKPIEALAEIYRFYLAPLDCDRRLRERIEAALAGYLYAQPGVIGAFQERGIRYRGRRDSEDPIKVVFQSEAHLVRSLTAPTYTF